MISGTINRIGGLFGALLLFVCSAAGATGQDVAKPEKVRRVFLVDSYSPEDLWTAQLCLGLKEALDKKDLKIKYESSSLSIRFHPGLVPSPIDIEAIRAKIATVPYDLIILSNNAITDLFLSGQIAVPPGTPLLVSAYHGALPQNRQPGMNITGINTPLNLIDNIRLARRLNPRNPRLAIVVEATADNTVQEKLIQKGLPPETARHIRLIKGVDYTTEELFAEIRKLPADSTVLFHSWFSTKEDEPENSYTVLPRLREIFPGLIIGKYDCYIELGAAGGLVPSGIRQGRQAGKLAYRILRGENPADIPVQDTVIEYILDDKALRKAGIDPADVPRQFTGDGSAGPLELNLLNTPPDFLERHFLFFLYAAILLVILLLVLIIKLLVNRRAQGKIDAMFRSFPARIFVVDEEFRILFRRIPDTTGKELRKYHSLYDFDDEARDLFIDCVRQALAGGKMVETDYQLFGEIRHAKFVPLPESNPFHTRAVLWTSGDISELQQANLEKFRLAERSRFTLEAIGDGVIVTDNAGLVTLINPVAAKLTGIPPEKALGRPVEEVYNIFSYIDGEKLDPPLREALKTGRIITFSNHSDLIAADGTVRHIADTAAPIMDTAGKIDGGVLVFRDVTDDYEQRDRLRTNEILMRNAAKIGKFTYFRCNRDRVLNVVIEDENLWPHRDNILVRATEWIDPEDVEQFEQEWQRIIGGKVPVIRVAYSASPGGRKRYFEMGIERIVDEITGETEYCGVIQDVTPARENELRYRDNLTMLETIMNNLPGCILVKNVEDEFRYVMCNNQFEELIGLPKERIIGSRDRDIFPNDEAVPLAFLEEDKSILDRGGEPLDTVETFRNAGGRKIITRTIRKLINRHDGTRLIVGISIDISRQYELEQEQQKTIEALNYYVKNEQIVNQSLRRISIENDFDTAINEMLRIVGENIGADRTYIFSYTAPDYTRSTNDYEWARDGVEPEIDNLQDADMTDHPMWQATLLAGRDIILPDIADPPEGFEAEAEFLSLQDIKSLLASGIWVNGKLTGYVGLDFVKAKKNITECDIQTVHSIVNLYLIARERQRQMNRVADSVALQRQIVDNVGIPLMLIDLDCRIITANPSAAREYHIQPEKLPGLDCREVFCREGDSADRCPIRETIASGRTHIAEEDADGRKHIVTTVPIFDRNGKLQYLLRSAVDITEITRQKLELQKAMELAQAADRAKSYFLASISHELRTPLNAVIGFSELLQHGDIAPEEQSEYLQSINFAGNALLNLINDVLDLSRLEADRMTLSEARTDVASLIIEIAAIFKLKAQEKQISLKIDCSDIGFPLYVDNLRLRQIVLNLIGNAVKFTSRGTVTVHADFKAPPTGGADRGTLTLRVADTGIGISPENARKIFEPFIQEGVTRGNNVYEGSGLGLAITQRLVTRMGGEITLASEPGKGSVFTVTLHEVRFDRPDLSAAEEADEAPKRPNRSLGENLRVLVVDDVPMNLKVMQAMLRRLHIAAATALSGAEALEILRHDRNFNLILTDLWMPEMSGTEFAEAVKQEPELAAIPIAAITADTEFVAEPPPVFSGTVLKPITTGSLSAVIHRLTKPTA